MFPDPTRRWKPYPSIIDGVTRPFVESRGVCAGLLHLIVLEGPASIRAFKLMTAAQLHASYEEMIYSIASHGDAAGSYDGTVYVKEAIDSRLLEAWQDLDP